MKHWADHKSCNNEKVSCPYCRQEWCSLTQVTVEAKESNYKFKSSTHIGFRCNACKINNIVGERYRCITCGN